MGNPSSRTWSIGWTLSVRCRRRWTRASTNLRVATDADHADAVAFAKSAIGAPEGFLVPYLAERIERAELLLDEEGGSIRATGECRVDRTHTGYAHLGLIVGSQLMNALVADCRRRDLQPLCSTEPTNFRRAG